MPKKTGPKLGGALRGRPGNTDSIINHGLKKFKNPGSFIKLVLGDQEILIDKNDVKKLDVSKVLVNSDGYVRYGKQLLHRIIIDPPEGFEVDHRNRNPFDNRRCNLRICTHSQNCMNRPKPSSNKTGFKGVVYSKRYRKYRAQIKAQGIYHWLGYFASAREAAKAYAEAAVVYHGEYRSN